MSKLYICRTVSKILPPLFANYFRQIYYPFPEAIEAPVNFTRNSITGSPFTGSTADYHGQQFAIHGFFDWRNILIAKTIAENIDPSIPFDIIEIGANIGTETIGFADIIRGRGTVHAFEPLQMNLRELEMNCILNPALPVKVYPVALGKEVSSATFLVPPENYSGRGKVSQTDDDSVHNISVSIFPLDHYINDFNNPKAIFIDVEGYEPLVLDGGPKTIEKYRPVVVLEVSSSLLAEHGHSNRDILDFFDKAGYSCHTIGRLIIQDVQRKRLKSYTRDTNWICIPNEAPGLIGKIRKKIYSYHIRPLVKV